MSSAKAHDFLHKTGCSMQLAALSARERVRTLVAQDEGIWIWPGVLLTCRYGGAIVPASGDIIRFWVTRLHGPEALYKDIVSGVTRAAWFLTLGEDSKAQEVLDALGLVTLPPDGAALMKAIACELGTDPLNLQIQDGPKTWNTKDILHHETLRDHRLVSAPEQGF